MVDLTTLKSANMKKGLLLSTLCILCLIANAQYFQHIYYSTPKNENEWFNHGFRDTLISDSALNPNAICYAATGYFQDKITGNPNVERPRFVTTNKWGTPITNAYYKVYSSNQNTEYDAYLNFIERTPDGYIMVGKVSSGTGDTIPITGTSDLFILRVTNNGNVTYAKRVDIGYSEEGMCIQKMNNSTDYIICGTRSRTNSAEAIVMRFTLAGAIVWIKAFNFNTTVTNYYATANHLAIDANDNSYMVGSFRHNATGQIDVLAFGVDQNGNILQHVTIGTSTRDETANSIRTTNTAGKYVISGHVHLTGQKGSDGLVFHYQPATATVSNYHHIHSWDVNPTSMASVTFEDIIQRVHPVTNVHTYFATGVVTKAANGGNDAIVYKLNTTLDPIREYHYGDPQNDFAKSIDIINYNDPGDGIIFFGGYGNASPASSYSYMVKTYFNGVVNCNFDPEDSLKTNISPTIVELDSIFYDNDTLISLYASKFSQTDTILCQDSVVTGGSSALSVNVSETRELRIWPNPISEGSQLTIEYNTELSGEVNISVRDLYGRILYSELMYMEQGINRLQTSVFDHLPPGSYFIHLSDPYREMVLKVIK